MYPAVSSEVLSFYLCTQINGIWYLINDFNLHCFDSSWNQYLGVDILLLFLYPIGIPTFIFCFLFKARKRLRDPANLQALGFLYEAYNAKQWWFELVDMANKFFLTSLLAFFPVSSQMPVGMVWIILYTYVILFSKPYVRAYDDRLHLYANIHLFLIMLMALTLQNTEFIVGSTTDVLASLILLVVLGLLILILLFNGYVFVRKFIRNRQRIQKIREEEHLVENPMQNFPEMRGSIGSSEEGGKENAEMVNPMFYKSNSEAQTPASKNNSIILSGDRTDQGVAEQHVVQPRHNFARPDLVDRALSRTKTPQVQTPSATPSYSAPHSPSMVDPTSRHVKSPPPQMIQPVFSPAQPVPRSSYVFDPMAPPPLLSAKVGDYVTGLDSDEAES